MTHPATPFRPVPPRRPRRGVIAWLLVAFLVGVGGLFGLLVAVDRWWGLTLPGLGRFTSLGVDEPGPRPAFHLPFTCGERWQLTTYASHNPEDKKLDMFHVGGETAGAVVRASAPGRVRQLVRPGGVKIDHGGRWYTLYLHMDSISVDVGDEIAQGQEIGRVGSVGTRVAHLHYEQLFDQNGDGNARTWEIVHPVIQGERYSLTADSDFPVVESTNGC